MAQPDFEVFRRPESLVEARRNVLDLPGFLEDPRILVATPETIDFVLGEMIAEITDAMDAQNMVAEATYAMALSRVEAEDFFRDPNRRPYKSPFDIPEDFESKSTMFFYHWLLSCRAA